MSASSHISLTGGLEQEEDDELVPVVEIRTHTDESFQAGEEQEEELEEAKDPQDVERTTPITGRSKGKGKKKPAINLPEPPEFHPLIQQYRRSGVNLDPIFQEQIPPPITLFRFFFTNAILNTIILDTNLYAESKKTTNTG
ncbi:hypothetical protein CPC16_005409, partial [Podila verticillata]